MNLISNFRSAYMYYFDNPGGMIPTWLINWAAKVRIYYLNSSMCCVHRAVGCNIYVNANVNDIRSMNMRGITLSIRQF